MKCNNCKQEFLINFPENHTLKNITMITWTCNRCNTENREYVRK